MDNKHSLHNDDETGPGSWRTRHLKVRSSYLLQRVQEHWLTLEHIDGVAPRADLSTKAHSNTRLYALLNLWRFEIRPPTAEALLMARMTAIIFLARALESMPCAMAAMASMMPTRESVQVAGVDELMFFTALACVVTVLAWALAKLLGKKLCGSARSRKAKKLKFGMCSCRSGSGQGDEFRSFTCRSWSGSMASTTATHSLRTRSIAAQIEDWARTTP